MLKNDEIQNLINEIRNEQHAIEDDDTLKTYIKDAEYAINTDVGFEIDYVSDLNARKYLKNFVLYDRYKKLAEFKVYYVGDLSDLQSKYFLKANSNTDV